MSKRSLPLFSSRSFIESGLKCMCLIHFEFIFVYGAREYSNYSLTVEQDFWWSLSLTWLQAGRISIDQNVYQWASHSSLGMGPTGSLAGALDLVLFSLSVTCGSCKEGAPVALLGLPWHGME